MHENIKICSPDYKHRSFNGSVPEERVLLVYVGKAVSLSAPATWKRKLEQASFSLVEQHSQFLSSISVVLMPQRG